MHSGVFGTALVAGNCLLAALLLSCAPSDAASAQTYSLYSHYLPSDSLASKAQAALKQPKQEDAELERHKHKAEFTSPVDGYFIQVFRQRRLPLCDIGVPDINRISCAGTSVAWFAYTWSA